MLKNRSVRYILSFCLLVLLQVMVFNRITFFGFATPYIYTYFILKYPIGLNRNLGILLGFFLGFSVDVFCNTPGVHAAATTLIAFITPYLHRWFFVKDDNENDTPSLALLGVPFVKFVVSVILIHQSVLYIIDSFSFFNIKLLLLRIVCSTLLTVILILVFEGFLVNNKRAWRKIT